MTESTNTQPQPDFMEAEAQTTPQESMLESAEFPSAEYGEPGEAQEVTDITELDLHTEALPDVDEKKLEERMEYAPSLQPGKFYDFIFSLDDKKPFEAVTIKGAMHAQFNWNGSQIREDGTPGKSIRFNQANTFRSGKMEASRVEELLFALGLLKRFQAEKVNHAGREKSFILELLQEATANQTVLRGQVNWRRYDKATKTTWSTNPAKPYKKKDKDTGNEITVTEQPWPKGTDGKLINRPDDWEGNYGNEIISRVAPTKATLDAGKQEATQS